MNSLRFKSFCSADASLYPDDKLCPIARDITAFSFTFDVLFNSPMPGYLGKNNTYITKNISWL